MSTTEASEVNPSVIEGVEKYYSDFDAVHTSLSDIMKKLDGLDVIKLYAVITLIRSAEYNRGKDDAKAEAEQQ